MSTQQPDAWSEPVSDDEAAQQDDSPVDERGKPSAAEATSPSSGLADPAPEMGGAGTRPAAAGGGDLPQPDDEREHPADFAAAGYDERQEDARPDSARETPDEVAEH